MEGQEQTSRGRSAARTAALFVCLAVIIACAAWPFRSHFLFEWDSVQLALGAQDFDVRRHQPHPPGYPLWVLLTRLLNCLTADLNLAQILLAQAFTAGAAVVLLRFGQALSGAWTGVLAALFVLLAPPVLQANLVATTYTADLLTSALLGLLSARLWDGERRWAVPAAVAGALCAGVRPSGALLMGPLVLVSLFRACRGRLPVLLASLAAGCAVALAWFIPVVRASGGWEQYRQLSQVQYTGAFRTFSWLYGAPWRDHLAMIRHVSLWYAASLAAPAALALVLYALGGRTAAARAADDRRPAWRRPAFYLLWLLPGLAFNCLLHAAKPGYVLISLPPVALLLAAAAGRGLAGCAARWPAQRRRLTAAALVCAAGLSLALFGFPYERLFDRPGRQAWRALFQTSLGQVRTADEEMRTVISAIRQSDVPPEQARLVVVHNSFYSPNWRKVSWYLPELAPINLDDTREIKFPAGVRRIWWITFPRPFPPLLAEAYPGTRLVASGLHFALWQK